MKTRKRHDTGYPPTFTIEDSNGAVDLSAATSVRFIVSNLDTGVIKINADTVINPDQVNHKGECTYNWQAVDVDTIGVYRCELRVLWNNGTQTTFPSDGYERLILIEDLDNL